MTKWLVVALCSLGLAAGCGDDDQPGPVAGTGGAGGTHVDAGQGGTPGTGGSAGAGGGAGTGGSPGTGGVVGAGGDADAGPDAVDTLDGGADAGPDAAGADGALPDALNEMTSMMITNAAGGTLSWKGASLVVPPGVLSADKVLTLSVRAATAGDPGFSDLVSDIYEFGPDGTTFTVPVSLTLPLSVTVPAGKKVVVAWMDAASGQWFPVDSTVAADHVTGRVSHFTHFGLIEIPMDQFCAFGGACGGSLDGTWSYSQSCLQPAESDAFDCGGAGKVKLRQVYSIGGTVTVAQGRFNASQMITTTATLFYTPACMTVLRQDIPNADCATLQMAWRMQNSDPNKPPPPWICAGSVDLGCSCQLTNSGSQTATGAVVITGNQVAFNQDGKAADTPADYCVRGNSLSVHSAEGDVYTAVKQ